MKIHNIAVAGIFVTIFGLINTAHADTVIASQAYVDAKDDLKQNTLTSGTGGNVAVSAGSGSATTAITGVTANNGVITFTTQTIDAGLTASDVVADNSTSVMSITNGNTIDDKAPSVRAVYNMVRKSDATGGAIRAATSASDTLVPTEKAVASDKESDNVIKSSNTTRNATVGGIQQSILYSGNTASTNNHTNSVDTTDIAANAAVLTTNATVKANGDDYVPTVAAVEARVKAVTKAGGDTNRDELTARNSTTHAITSAGSDTEAPSTALLVDVLQTLDSTTYVSESESGTKPVTSITEVDGKIYPNRGTITYKAGLNNQLMNTNTGAALGSSDCKKDNPCVLTYYTDGANTFMRWTPMDTNSTNANVTLASGE